MYLTCKGRHQSDVDKILARGICCQNENEAVMIIVFTDPRRPRSGRVRRLRKNPPEIIDKLNR